MPLFAGLLIVPLLIPLSVKAQATLADKGIRSNDVVISIIIDDIGNQMAAGERALKLPGAVTYSILPHLASSPRLADLAYKEHKEVMLHLPMEADKEEALGPGGLTHSMTEQQLKNEMRQDINAIPHLRGFNNHMGSLLTKNSRYMNWVMQMAMFRNDLYFVDSRTTRYTVALKEAKMHGIRSARRDVFLDYKKDNAAIVRQQLKILIEEARKKGTALAIGHPYRDTLKVLETWLPTLAKQGIKLVPVSELISIRKARRNQQWQLSSSR